MITVSNRLPTDNPAEGVRLGVLRAEGVDAGRYPRAFEAALRSALEHPFRDEERTGLVRDMLRNGTYKPTGRGKPASEYLARAADEGTFPRINALVDVNNLVSLWSGLPISLWDLHLADADRYTFRLGREGEEYVFNGSGQVLSLHDLAVGARDRDDRPLVSPIKDAHATKTTAETTHVAAVVYAPAKSVAADELAALCIDFTHWLGGCGACVRTSWAVVPPGGVRHF